MSDQSKPHPLRQFVHELQKYIIINNVPIDRASRDPITITLPRKEWHEALEHDEFAGQAFSDARSGYRSRFTYCGITFVRGA